MMELVQHTRGKRGRKASNAKNVMFFFGFPGGNVTVIILAEKSVRCMASLRQLNQQEALNFLESREVQKALVETFCRLYTRKEREAIQAEGFWTFAKRTSEEPGIGGNEKGKFTKEMHFLSDLYLALRRKHPAAVQRTGSLGGETKYNPGFSIPSTRRHIRDKFKHHAYHLARLDVALLDEGNKPNCVLVVYPSREVASAAHKKRGRPAKHRIEYPTQPVDRRIENLRKGPRHIFPRSLIARAADDFIHQNEDSVLVLCGSCNSGKTTWMLDYHEAHVRDSIFYPFDNRSEEISSQRVFSRHLATRCASLAGFVPPPKLFDTLVTLEDLWANLTALNDRLKVKPIFLLDAVEQAGPSLDPLLAFVRQCVTAYPGVYRFVLTVRTPTHLLPRLQSLPKARISRVFDSQSAVLEFMQSWCRNRPVPESYLRTIYEQAGANLRLASTMMTLKPKGNRE